MRFIQTLASCAMGAAGLALPVIANALSETQLDKMGGRLQAQIDGNTYVLPSLRTDIDADVRGDLVTVTVKQRFENSFEHPMHAVYLFPLNKDAAVFEMIMEVGDERIRAQIDRIEQANKTFNAAKTEGKSAALLEQHRPNMFTQKIANLAPGHPIDVTLRYVHTVPKVDGDYELVLPLVVGPRFQPPGSGEPEPSEPTRFERFTVPDDGDPVQAGAEHAVAPEWEAFADADQPSRDRYWGGSLLRVNAGMQAAHEQVRVWNVQDQQTHDQQTHDQQTRDSGVDSGAPYSQWEIETLPDYPPVSDLDLPLSITEDRIGLKVTINAQIPVQAIESRTHAITTRSKAKRKWSVELAQGRTVDNRDFVLRYRLAGGRTQAGALGHRDERGGFFSALIEPPAVPAATEITPRELVFVLDASGSMSGLPMQASKAFMRASLKGLRSTDSFRIIRFSDSATEFSEAPLPATALNVVRGIRYTDALRGSGGTMMSSGVRQALDVPIPEGSLRLVVFLTDGYIGNDAEIIDLINDRVGDARLYAFGVGTAVNRYLLSEMGRVGRGFTRYMDPTENVDEVALELVSRIASPVLTDIRIDWGELGVADVYPSRIPDLFAGQSIRVQGRTADIGDHEIVVHGLVNGRAASMPARLSLPEATQLDASNAGQAIALVWARSAIAENMRKLTTPGRTVVETNALKQQVTQLGLDYSLITRWTAFVAVSEKIYNSSTDTTPTLPVPLSKVAGASEKAYASAAPAYAGHAAPEPPVVLGLAVTATLGVLAFARRRRAVLEGRVAIALPNASERT